MKEIITLRHRAEIEEAIQSGERVLIREIKENPQFNSRKGLFKNKQTNEIQISDGGKVYAQYTCECTDFGDRDIWEEVIPVRIRPDLVHEKFFAAYLVPKVIHIDETVLISDLIEDYYGGQFWSSIIRVEQLLAIWDGHDLKIQYDPDRDGVCRMVG